jgi:serine protease Do
LCTATSAVEIRSPLEDASALQRQLKTVVDDSCESVFAVTAFFDDTSDPALFQKSIPSTQFAQIAERAQRSCGSAFAIDTIGYLLTNEHVVSGATSVWITNDKGQTVPALIVGTDPRGDLAVLRIPVQTTPVKLSGKLEPTRGDLVVTIGNPGGTSITGVMAASVGTVSAVGRALPTLSAREHRFYGDLLQITAPITTGSSGGPLLDLSGNTIGMVCAVVPSSLTDQNIGFAIPLSPAVRARVERLKKGEESVYGFLGVNVSAADAASNGLPTPGARVDHIDPGTPAVGVLQVGDIVLSFDGKPIASDIDFIRLAGDCAIDRDVSLKVLRDENPIDVSIRPRLRVLPIDPVSQASQRLVWAGVTFANHHGKGVVVINVDERADTLLKDGQVVSHVNAKPVNNLVDLLNVLYAHAGEALEMEVDSEPELSVQVSRFDAGQK